MSTEPTDRDQPDPVVHQVEQSAEQIEDYWSEERRADAVPIPMPQPDSKDRSDASGPDGSQSGNDEGQIR